MTRWLRERFGSSNTGLCKPARSAMAVATYENGGTFSSGGTIVLAAVGEGG